MRVARAVTTQGVGFVFSLDGLDGWVSANSLAMDLPSLQSVVDHLPRISESVLTADHDLPREIELRCPIPDPGKILGVGYNDREHIPEVGKQEPVEPYVFSKYPSSICRSGDEIRYPVGLSSQLDYDCELAVVIGPLTRRVDASSALDSVLDYTVANGVSTRDLESSLGQVSRSKGMDTFCPIGPWLTTVGLVPDPHSLSIRTWVDGELRQNSSTSDMLFRVPELVAYVSTFVSLHTGDIILKGTPAGVGSGLHPPCYLEPGDTVRCEIETLGALSNCVST